MNVKCLHNYGNEISYPFSTHYTHRSNSDITLIWAAYLVFRMTIQTQLIYFYDIKMIRWRHLPLPIPAANIFLLARQPKYLLWSVWSHVKVNEMENVLIANRNRFSFVPSFRYIFVNPLHNLSVFSRSSHWHLTIRKKNRWMNTRPINSPIATLPGGGRKWLHYLSSVLVDKGNNLSLNYSVIIVKILGGIIKNRLLRGLIRTKLDDKRQKCISKRQEVVWTTITYVLKALDT